MCFWVFPKGSADLPSHLSFLVACGDQIFDNSTIMIKSSDKSLQNTYRILRVLSNKDYLATDHEGGKYIFSQTKASLLANIPKTVDHISSKTPLSFLLHHIQILTIDNLQYAVFGVGNHQVIWAPLLKSKLLQSQKRVQKIFENSILKLLKELIWMGGKAKQYLDMRNFWFVNEELCLLLIPRVRKNSNSLRKSEQVFQDKLSTIDAVIDTEKTLMKEFGLFLWQVCFQQNFYESLDSPKHLQVKQILQKIIGKAIQFEELVSVIKKKQISQQNGAKVRFKNKSKMDIFSRRKTTGSIEKSQNSSSNSLGISRMNTGFTENLKGVRSFQKGNTTSSIQKSNQNTIFHRKFHIKQSRSMSQGDNLSKNCSRNSHLAHPRLFQRHTGQQQSKNTIHYQTWLQKKKYSYDTKQKLLRNSLVARQKYNQTILNSSDEKQIPKFEDTNFKDKLLAKVIKFKSAFKSNYSTISKPEQIALTQKQSQTVCLNQIPQKPFNIQTLAQNDDKSLNKISLSLKREYNINVPSNSTIPIINNQPISSNNSQQKFSNRPKKTVQSNRKQYEQGRNSKYQRSKMVISSQREQGIQVVELRCQPNLLQQKQSKEQTKSQFEGQIIFNEPASYSKIEDFTKVKEIFDQYLLLINILGDITVRAVKIKDKLSQLNWRLITYFLYERFYFQREKLLTNMEKGKVIVRLYSPSPSSQQWISFCKSKEYRQIFNKVKQQNVQILATLEKLGRKLLQQGELDEKIEHFLINQKELSGRKNSKLRSQLCRFLAATIMNQYQYVVEQALNQELITRFLIDCTFGMMIICELEGLFLREHLPNVNNYKQYSKGLSGLGKWIGLIRKILTNSK